MAMPQPAVRSEPLHRGAGRSGAAQGRLVVAPDCRAAPRRSRGPCLRAIGREGWFAQGCFLMVKGGGIGGYGAWHPRRPTSREWPAYFLRVPRCPERSLRRHKRLGGTLNMPCCLAAGWRCRSAPGSQPWMPQCLWPQGLRPLVRARRGARRALPASACARLRALLRFLLRRASPFLGEEGSSQADMCTSFPRGAHVFAQFLRVKSEVR